MNDAQKENDPNQVLLEKLGYEKKGARGRGRPTKLTKGLMDAVCNYIREMHFTHVACARAGITPQSMNAWRRRGKAVLEAQAEGGEAAAKVAKDELIFADFEAAITQAEADRTTLLVRLNLRHAARNPEIAWKLLAASESAYREQRTVTANVNANVKSEHEHNVNATVDHRHAHVHTSTLTVQGADALRRDALLGGKSIEQARLEHAQAKRALNATSASVVFALPENGDE